MTLIKRVIKLKPYYVKSICKIMRFNSMTRGSRPLGTRSVR